MKNYRITVNGNVYDVTVEETKESSTPYNNKQKTSVPATKSNAKQAKQAKQTKQAEQGSIKINAPVPGKIIAVKADVGKKVKRGDVIILLEAMKMENEIVAPQDGTVAGIHVSVGSNVETGNLLATLK